jgi:hypothetical protein
MPQIVIRLLDDVQSVNSMELATEVSTAAGDPLVVNLQLVNHTRLSCDENSPAVRYIPAAGATLTVVCENIDNSKRVTKIATQPFAQDGSIWRIDLTPQDTLKMRGTITLSYTLTEGTRTISGRLLAAILVMP